MTKYWNFWLYAGYILLMISLVMGLAHIGKDKAGREESQGWHYLGVVMIFAAAASIGNAAYQNKKLDKEERYMDAISLILAGIVASISLFKYHQGTLVASALLILSLGIGTQRKL